MSEVRLKLHKRQSDAFLSRATEILYGGAAGGGKSHLMRVVALMLCMAVDGLQVYLFRRVSDDLRKNHLEGVSGLRSMLAPLMQSGHVKFNDSKGIFEFWNGAKIYLCHCQHEKDMYKYQGAEIHVLLIDELTLFTESIYRFLRGRVRLGGLQVPKEYRHKLPLILCGSNPGNIGHAWVKAMFVDYAPPMEITRTPEAEGGMLRQYIPARLSDNPTLLENDPQYESRLAGLGSPSLVAAMKNGDWDIVDGAYFAEFRRERHVLPPFSLPVHWPRIMAFDWGYAKPFCVLWGAVSDGTLRLPGTSRLLPKNAVVVYREWYGSTGEANVGLRLPANEIAAGIKRMSRDERFAQMVADPAIFASNGGESQAETMQKAGVQFWPADNKRVAGWQQVHLRLQGTEGSEGEPLLYVFDTCRDLIRTLPALQHDKHNPEDVDSEMEDHAPDTLRYLCMTRVISPPQRQQRHERPDWLKI
nr:MAG TPA: Large subunit terminase [Caudoviricetes sp.]